jgi:hypothetical protein
MNKNMQLWSSLMIFEEMKVLKMVAARFTCKISRTWIINARKPLQQ